MMTPPLLSPPDFSSKGSVEDHCSKINVIIYFLPVRLKSQVLGYAIKAGLHTHEGTERQ